jgi:hypothetical protein
MGPLLLATAFLATLALADDAATSSPKPEIRAKYDAYLRATNDRIRHELRSPAWPWPELVRSGQIIVRPWTEPGDIDIGGALIHDWMGTAFIPGVRLPQAVAFLQDYPSHKNYYRPEVVETRLISHDGDDWVIHYRLVKHYIVTVVLDVDQTVHYDQLSETRLISGSEATRIVDVRAKPGHNRGFLWRLNTWWRLEEKDGGVYVECEMVSLTRSPPLGLGWLINPIVRTLPRDSLARLLTATRAAVQNHAKSLNRGRTPRSPIKQGLFDTPR